MSSVTTGTGDVLEEIMTVNWNKTKQQYRNKDACIGLLKMEVILVLYDSIIPQKTKYSLKTSLIHVNVKINDHSLHTVLGISIQQSGLMLTLNGTRYNNAAIIESGHLHQGINMNTKM